MDFLSFCFDNFCIFIYVAPLLCVIVCIFGLRSSYSGADRQRLEMDLTIAGILSLIIYGATLCALLSPTGALFMLIFSPASIDFKVVRAVIFMTPIIVFISNLIQFIKDRTRCRARNLAITAVVAIVVVVVLYWLSLNSLTAE
nr:hypothetical protein [uncultured Campylobacter sp.]